VHAARIALSVLQVARPYVLGYQDPDLLAIKADMQTAADALRSALAEVESSLKTRGGIEPVAWLCEFVREDDSIDTQVVLTDPECTRWADVPDSDGVSPFRVTPLYAASPVGQDSAAPSGAARPLTSEEEEAAWDSITEQECSCCTAAVRLFCRINGIALADAGVPSVLPAGDPQRNEGGK
jgi:hypothetical protein